MVRTRYKIIFEDFNDYASESDGLRKDRATQQFAVIDEYTNEEIGIVKWKAGWQQIVFKSHTPIELNVNHLRIIWHFIRDLQTQHKMNNADKKEFWLKNNKLSNVRFKEARTKATQNSKF